jgi:methylmalonyl-CoA/ethylmalonyl-CoA epimerase
MMKFKHLGVAVADLGQALSVYREVFEYRLIAGPYEDPIQKVSVCFVGSGRDGDLILELVAPLGEKSPVHRVLTKQIGAYHACFEVEDLDQTLKHVRAMGCVVFGQPVPAVAFGGRRIAWFYTPSRQLVEILEQ